MRKEQKGTLREALKIFQQMENRIGVARAYHGLAAYHQVHDLPNHLCAAKWLNRRAKIIGFPPTRYISRPEGVEKRLLRDVQFTEAEVSLKWGGVARLLPPWSKHLIRKAQNLLEHLRCFDRDDVDFQIFVLLALARCYMCLEGFPFGRSEQKLLEAKRYIRWIGKPHAYDQVLKVLGKLEMKRGKEHFSKAESLFRKAMEQAMATDEQLLIARDKLCLANLYFWQHRWRAMVKEIAEALGRARMEFHPLTAFWFTFVYFFYGILQYKPRHWVRTLFFNNCL